MIKIYYDETNHNRKIGVNSKAELRFNNQTEFFFLYGFIEISDQQLVRIAKLETEFKKIWYLPEIKELKSSSRALLPKDICKLKDNQIKFLTNIFELLNNENKIISIGYLNKLEPFFDYLIKPKYVTDAFNNSYAFMYSFQKYLSIRRLYDLNLFLSKEYSMKQIYQRIIKWLKEDSIKMPLVKEKNLFQELILTLEAIAQKDKRNWTLIKLKWSYETIAWNLAKILDEKIAKNVLLIYDSFPEIKNMWNDFEQNLHPSLNFCSVDMYSKNELGLRIVDWVIGFLRKFIISLNQKSIYTRQYYYPKIKLNQNMIDFINKNKKLFIAFRNLINKNIWSTFASSYSDDFLMAMIVFKIIKENEILEIKNIMIVYYQQIKKINS